MRLTAISIQERTRIGKKVGERKGFINIKAGHRSNGFSWSDGADEETN